MYTLSHADRNVIANTVTQLQFEMSNVLIIITVDHQPRHLVRRTRY